MKEARVDETGAGKQTDLIKAFLQSKKNDQRVNSHSRKWSKKKAIEKLSYACC